MTTTITNHKWSDEEIKSLLTQWHNDIPITEIATSLNVTSKALERFVRRLRVDGIPLKKRNIGKHRPRYMKPWTQAEVEYFIRRRDQGATSEDIGQEIGRTYHAVEGMRTRARKEGVPIKLLSHGNKRLWNVDTIRAQLFIEEAA